VLLKASENGDAETVSALLKQGMDANVRNEVWCAPEASFLGLLPFVVCCNTLLHTKAEEYRKAWYLRS